MEVLRALGECFSTSDADNSVVAAATTAAGKVLAGAKGRSVDDVKIGLVLAETVLNYHEERWCAEAVGLMVDLAGAMAGGRGR